MSTALVHDSAAVDEELARLLVRTAEEIEARSRSVTSNVLVTLAAVFVAMGPHLPEAAYVLGGVTGAEAARVVLPAWCVFELATLAFHLLGPRHILSVVLSALDALGRYAAFLVLIYLSGSASSPLWLIGMVNAFVWNAKPPWRARLELALVLVTYLALATAFLVRGHVGDAWLTVLVLLASTIGHTMTAGMVARNARVQAERDVIERELGEAALRRDRERMARELHDGVGADIMTLVMRLQRAARRGTNPKAERLAGRARDLLDELRGVVWSLRNQQGTLAELGKLIDATCRGVRGEIAYERSTPLAMARERIGPSAALAALTAARDLVRLAATRSGVTKVTLTLSVANALELTVVDDGLPLSSEAHDMLQTSLEGTLRATDASPGGIVVSSLPNGAGVQMQATIALDPMTSATPNVVVRTG